MIFILFSTFWNVVCPPQLMQLSGLLLLLQHRVWYSQPPNRWGTNPRLPYLRCDFHNALSHVLSGKCTWNHHNSLWELEAIFQQNQSELWDYTKVCSQYSSWFDFIFEYKVTILNTVHCIFSVGFLTGAGSDYAAFMHYLGITSVDMSYYYDRVCGQQEWYNQALGIKKLVIIKNTSSIPLQSKTRARIYPAYHTAYDTFDYASTYIDPGELNTKLLKSDNTIIPLLIFICQFLSVLF